MPVNRLEGNEKVTGKAIFAGDMQLHGTLVGKILRSKVAHARIRNINTERAAQIPGVLSVVKAEDFPAVRIGLAIRDEEVMSRDTIRYIGEPLVALAAVDAETAERALRLIELDLEELPQVFSADEGLADNAPLIHENWLSYQTTMPLQRNGNVAAQFTINKGNVEAGFAASDLIVEDSFSFPIVYHAPLEARAVVAYFDPCGKLTVWCGVQSAFSVRRGLASYLQLPMSHIRVVGLRVGGAFGGKNVATIEPIAALLAMKTGRPVKIEMSRQDDFYASNPRHSMKIWVKTGAKRDGTLVARQAKILVDTGAYANFGPQTTAQAATLITGPYRYQHLLIEGTCVYTNKISCGACRGPGAPQAHFAAETQMDRIARELSISPFDLRRNNALKAGDDTGPGQILSDYGYVNVIDVLEKAVKEDLQSIPIRPGKSRGIGIAGCFWGMSGFPSAATISLNEDGSAILSTGAVELGHGVDTAMAILVSQELSIPIQSIKVLSGDTDSCPFDFGAVGSRTTQALGTPVVQAARQIKHKLLSFASRQLSVAAEELTLRDSQIIVDRDPSRKLDFAQVVTALTHSDGPIVVSVGNNSPSSPFDPERVSSSVPTKPFFVFGAQGVAVDVDVITGKVNVCKVVAVHDVGKAVYLSGVEGQIQGGVAMGLGYALSEEAILEQGLVVNANFLDYRVPTMLDVPEIVPIVIEKLDARIPEDIRGIGEPPTIPTVAAVSNAVYNAVGVRITSLPMTPEQVFRAMKSNGFYG